MAIQLVKPEKLVSTAVGMLEQELTIPRLIKRIGIDQFKGAKDDTINMKVEGILPHHFYAFRNDRSEPIKFDEFKERTVSLTMSGNIYSATKVTDEVNDFDLNDWGQVLRPQVKAVVRGIQHGVVNEFVNAPYQVKVGAKEGALRKALIEARRAMNKLGLPTEGRLLIVGTDFEAALLLEPNLNLTNAVAESRAESALASASLGSLYGYHVVVDQTIEPDVAYAVCADGVVMATGAPYIPAGVSSGATTSFEGFALRWIRDYESAYLQERSVVNTYFGTGIVKDFVRGWDQAANNGDGMEVISNDQYFVRGIKLELNGTTEYPTGELATITGLAPLAAGADGDPATV